MPKPKITGLLNNCALNSALPTLLESIKQLASREANGTLDVIASNVIVQHYMQLKDIFAAYYRIGDRAAFNWVQFNEFLTRHSFYAAEIIFAPVFRSFIAQFGPANGYAADDLWLLRDVQEDGRYNNLHYLEASVLFHNQFGISVEIYQRIEGQEDYRFISAKPTTNTIYPFEDTPTVSLYLSGGEDECGGHFEIQPHETLSEATESFNADITGLPVLLSTIHDGLSGSDNAYMSNTFIGHLVVYVGRAFTYALSAEAYVVSGRGLHNDTPAGRQTFAVILLSILFEGRDDLAQTCIDYMAYLTLAQHEHQCPAAMALLDELSTAIIDSNANLKDVRVESVTNKIRLFQLEKSMALDCEQLSQESEMPQVALVNAGRQLVETVALLHADTNDPLLLEVASRTNDVVAEPSAQNITDFRSLFDKLDAKSSWGKTLANLMFTVLGLALAVGAALGLVGSSGLAAPLAAGVGMIGAGIGFFRLVKDKTKPQVNDVDAPAP